MYNVPAVLKSLSGRVGWRPTNAPFAISSENSTSMSGRHFQSVHPIVSFNNILETMPSMEDNGSDIDELVFNKHLLDIQNDSILAVLDRVFDTDEILEQNVLFVRDYSTFNDIVQPVEIAGDFAGYMLNICHCFDKFVRLDSAVLFFAETATLQLKLVHSTVGEIWSKDVDVIGGTEVIVPLDDINLEFSSPKYRGGVFYLGYDPTGLKPMETVNPVWARSFHLGYRPITSIDGLLTIQDAIGTTNGLNLKFSVFKDFTNTIVSSPQLFDEAVGLSVAIRIIEQIVFTDKSNKTQREQTSDIMLSDMNLARPTETNPFMPGLKSKLDKEIKRLKGNLFTEPRIKTVTSNV